MMLLIYAVLLAAMLFAWFRWRRTAMSCIVLTFLLSVSWFLFHVHDAKYGFRLPWLQTHLQMPLIGGNHVTH